MNAEKRDSGKNDVANVENWVKKIDSCQANVENTYARCVCSPPSRQQQDRSIEMNEWMNTNQLKTKDAIKESRKHIVKKIHFTFEFDLLNRENTVTNWNIVYRDSRENERKKTNELTTKTEKKHISVYT